MPKEQEGNNKTSFSFDEVQAILKATIEGMGDKIGEAAGKAAAAAITESKKPTPEEIARNKRDKERMRISMEQDRLAKLSEQASCPHIHPSSGKPRLFKMEYQRPPEGRALLCSWCNKLWLNFDKETLAYKTGEEINRFNIMWNTPTHSESGAV